MRLFLVLTFLFALSHSAIADEAPALRDDDWSVASLGDSGFDVAKMNALTDKLERDIHDNAHAVLVEHDGKLVYEQYFEGPDQSWGSDLGIVRYDFDKRHDLRSVSKSVTALILGIAIGDHIERALATPIAEFFPKRKQYASKGYEAITLHHVLTMTMGVEWNEMTVPYSNPQNDEIQLYYNADPFRYVFEKAVRDEPGSKWYYNGGSTMLLAGVVQQVTGKTFLDYAHEALFKPLGITDVQWRGDNIWQRGLPSAASGLRLRARDLAKIGSLMLHDGQWQGKQIIPKEWVERSSIRHTEQNSGNWNMGGIYGYGYQWWHGNFRGSWGTFTAITGAGYGGQNLFPACSSLAVDLNRGKLLKVFVVTPVNF
ncbi:MAG: serine hydrolase, partial [Pseudomonadota bacterium]